MTALLDVNVLVALAWPNHIHHQRAPNPRLELADSFETKVQVADRRPVGAFVVKVGKQFHAYEEQVDLHGNGHDQRQQIDH